MNNKRISLPQRDSIGLSGQNNPKQQYIISDIMFDLYGKKGIKATPELKIKLSDKKYVIPDIVAEDNNGIVFVEICRTSMVTKDVSKVRLIMKKHTKPNEGFVYDYERNKWYKVRENKKRTEGSQSEIFEYDFSTVTK